MFLLCSESTASMLISHNALLHKYVEPMQRSPTESSPFIVHRPTQLHLKPAAKRGYASLMMLRRRRTSGTIRRSTMQHKLNPEQGQADAVFHPRCTLLHAVDLFH